MHLVAPRRVWSRRNVCLDHHGALLAAEYVSIQSYRACGGAEGHRAKGSECERSVIMTLPCNSRGKKKCLL